MPRRFIFKLQPVLDQREREEREQQRIVAELEAQRLRVEEELRRRQEQISSAKRDLRDLLSGPGSSIAADVHLATSGVHVPTVRMQAAASLTMAGQANQTAIQLAGAYARVDHARAQLLRLTTARKAVELLKERQLEQWKQDQQRREAAALDEIATIQYSRRTHAL